MIAAVDNTFLTLLLNPGAASRPNPATGQPASHCRQRLDALIDDMSKKGNTLLIPTPALAEALCCTEGAEAYYEELRKHASIELAAFDGRSAIELGRIIREAVADGDKRSGQTGDWQHVKMDRQIVAIAVAHSASVLYSDDQRQKNFAALASLETKSTWDLPLPTDHAQHHLSEQADPWPIQTPKPKLTDLEKPPES